MQQQRLWCGLDVATHEELREALKRSNAKKGDTVSEWLRLVCEILELEVEVIVEVGVLRGDNSAGLLEAFPKAILHLVDTWDMDEIARYAPTQSKADDMYRSVVGRFGDESRVFIHRMSSMEALHVIQDGVTLVYLDGDHSYDALKMDMIGWERKVTENGIIAGHDYGNRTFPEVEVAVDELCPNRVTSMDKVWLCLKSCGFAQ